MAMTWMHIGFIYVVTWSILLFAVLPVGVQREENPEAGHSAGAPKQHYLGRKFLATTVLAACVTWGIVAALEGGAVPIREAVR